VNRRAAIVSSALVAAGLTAACSSSGVATIRRATLQEPRVLELSFDTCNADLSFTLEETANEVRIAVRQENDEPENDCADALIVDLAQPLGDRAVVDESTGAAVDVTVWPEAN
jgi:hypothetical protein